MTAAGPAAPPGGATATNEKSTSTQIQAANDQSKRFQTAVDTVRSRSDTAAKSLLAISGVAFGALGITKATDLTPQYWKLDTGLSVAVVIAGFVLVAGALGWFSALLWRVSKPVFTSSNLEETVNGLAKEETNLVTKVYDEMARLNGVHSLLAYEARGWRLERIAERASAERRPKLQQQADLIRAEVQAVQARAAALVVRSRASRAVTGGLTAGLAGVFIVGLILLAGGAGYLTSVRNDARITTAKSCADAVTAIAKTDRAMNLPGECGARPTTSPPPPSPADAAIEKNRRDVSANLADSYQSCLRDQARPAKACAAQLDALVSIAGP